MGAGASSSKAGAAGSKSNGSKPMSRSATSTLARAATGLNLRLSQRGAASAPEEPPADAPPQLTAFQVAQATPHVWRLDGTLGVDSEAPPPPTAAEAEERKRLEEAETAQVEVALDKYCRIVRKVTLFSEMGDAEVEAAARALQVKHFKAGEIVYDEGDEGHDCFVIETGEVVASILIPGIRFAQTWEWKETTKYSSDRTAFFGERGLLRKEPRPARMTCRTDVKVPRPPPPHTRPPHEALPRGAAPRTCC